MSEQSVIPVGLCQCGCGENAPIATQSRKSIGRIKGQFIPFRRGHWTRKGYQSPEQHPRWNGGRHVHAEGYVMVRQVGHPRAETNNYVFEHLLVAERALGYPVPATCEVHHVNEIRSDNRGCNLVICQDSAYHKLLHARLRAYRGCGNPDAKRCWLCHQWDVDLKVRGRSYFHLDCFNSYQRQKYAQRKP